MQLLQFAAALLFSLAGAAELGAESIHGTSDLSLVTAAQAVVVAEAESSTRAPLLQGFIPGTEEATDSGSASPKKLVNDVDASIGAYADNDDLAKFN